jgi:hypothetical protein
MPLLLCGDIALSLPQAAEQAETLAIRFLELDPSLQHLLCPFQVVPLDQATR